MLTEIGAQPANLRTFFRTLERAHERDYRGQVAAAGFTPAARHGDDIGAVRRDDAVLRVVTRDATSPEDSALTAKVDDIDGTVLNIAGHHA
nr:hypothetical protein [Austwickia chelonae]